MSVYSIHRPASWACSSIRPSIVVEEDGRVWLTEFGAETALRREATASPSSGLYSFPKQRPTLRSSPMLSCDLETIRECIHTRARKGGTC